MTITEMINQIVGAVKAGDGQFLKTAKLLRTLYEKLEDEEPAMRQAIFEHCLAKAKIHKRKAYYLLEIDKAFGDLEDHHKRLAEIGWTKLSIIAKYVTYIDPESWLTLAEKMTAAELSSYIAGKVAPTHFVTFRLTEQQYSTIAGTLLVYGAYLTPNAGLANKELALFNVCEVAAKAISAPGGK